MGTRVPRSGWYPAKVFGDPGDVLKKREGTLSETPLPLLLLAVYRTERTCALLLEHQVVRKRICFEDGAPVACNSNLLHETIGKYLVQKGALAEADYQKTLADSVTSGAVMEELLVARKLVPPFEMFRHIQAALALRILDCFRWPEGRWKLSGDADPGPGAVRMKPVVLLRTAVVSAMPFELVEKQFDLADGRPLAAIPGALDSTGLKLSPKETRLMNALRTRPTYVELVARTGLSTEEVHRSLYALALAGAVDYGDNVSVSSPATESPSPEPAAAHESPRAEPARPEPPPAEDPPELRDALITAYLAHRARDPFDLLGVKPEAPAPARKAFLTLMERFNPGAFRSPELREKAEELLLAAARAYASIADPEQLALWRKRREAATRTATAAASERSSADFFKISTDLLDAGTQFAEGVRRLQANASEAAAEYFQYACEIEPRPLYRAHLAWARYLCNPAAREAESFHLLEGILREEPACDAALFFLGEIHRLAKRFTAAEQAYRAAFKVNPAARNYAERAHEMARAAKQPS